MGSAETGPPGRGWRRHLTAWGGTAVLVVGVLTGCGDDGGTGSGSRAGAELEGLVRDTPLEVGALELPEVTADGTEAPFRFTAPDGRLLFVTFGYTNCPDICPTTLYDLRKAREGLGDDAERVEAAFVTVDPDRDTPDVIVPYLASFVPEGGHAVRTADRATLERVQDGFGVQSEVVTRPDGTVDVSHSARSFVVDDTGSVVVEWSFGTSAEAMTDDLRILLDRQAS